MEADGDPVASDVTAAGLKAGDVLVVWHGVVELSYPAQTTATDAILIADD
jgi:hypothetical protein